MQTDELLKLAKKEKLQELEASWTAAIEQEDAAVEPLLEVVEVLVERGHGERAETLLWFLADALKDAGRLRDALKAARRGGQLMPRSSLLCDVLAGLYVQVHADRADVQDLVLLTVKSPNLALDEAIAGLENLMAVRQGSYVLDPQRGAVGRVEGLDVERGGLVVTFEDGEKVYGPSLVARLSMVDEEDFRALSVFEKDRLEKLAREDPEDLVCIVLSSLDRRMELRRLRLYLEPLVGSWAKWWSAARQVLERSAQVGMTEGRSPSLFLRSRPLTHAERLLKRLAAATEPVPKLAVALGILKEAREHGEVGADALAQVAAEVASAAAAGPSALALAAAGVLEDIRREFPDVPMPAGVPQPRPAEAMQEPEAFVRALADGAVLLRALDVIRELAPGAWAEFCAAVLPLAARDACGAIAARLAAAGEAQALEEARREALGRPEASPGALAWAWRDCVRQGPGEGAAVALRLFGAMADLVRAQEVGEEERRAGIAELRGALFMRNGEPLEQALRNARPEQIAAIKAVGEHNPGLTERMQSDLSAMLRKARPSLYAKAVPPWQEDTVYTTEAGMRKRRAELEQIVHERLPKVMREIGQAAGFGDVSDNAEYRTAVQERARLAEVAARIQEEIAEARLITREVASAGHVTVGSRVRARNLGTGEEETLTFLGPWDAQPAERVYAYNAPLGLAFMGKKPGETVTFRMDAEERRWEVLSVEPAV
jgi:transcription elongation factor GreA